MKLLLLVSNNDDEALFIMSLLAAIPCYFVVQVRTEREVFEIVKDVLPDLLLLDDRPADMHSSELYDQLESLLPVPLIWLISELKQNESFQTNRARAAQILYKPLNSDKLLCMIEQALRSSEAV